MNPEIKTLLENMEFHESREKPGLWSKEIDENESGIMGVTAYVDFRRWPEKGRRFYTLEGKDGIQEDPDIPTLAYFKEQRDKILGIHDNKRDGAGDLSVGDKSAGLDAGREAVIGIKPLSDMGSNPIHPNTSYKTPEPKEQGTKMPPNPNKQSSVPCVSGEKSSLLVPAGTIEDAIKLFKTLEDAKKRILDDKDVLWIGSSGAPTEKGKGQPHIKRSGWRKLARFFNLSVEPIKREQ